MSYRNADPFAATRNRAAFASDARTARLPNPLAVRPLHYAVTAQQRRACRSNPAAVTGDAANATRRRKVTAQVSRRMVSVLVVVTSSFAGTNAFAQLLP